MPVRPVARGLALGALGAAAVLGCTLDWGVRADPVEAGPLPTEDAPLDHTTTPDVVVDDHDIPTDGPAPDADVCDTLGKRLESRRKLARSCTLAANQCTETVEDVCCKVFVAKGDAGVTDAFAQAVADFKTANCGADCGAACSPATIGNCLQISTGEFACAP